MPHYDKEQSDLRNTFVEIEPKKCNLSNRCKLVLCISVSTMIMVGFGIADIYYAESYDGSEIPF